MHIGRPLRIAMVSEHYYPHAGGVSEHIYNLTRQLTARGHHVCIITGRFREQSDGIPTLPVGAQHVCLGSRNVPLMFNGAISRVTVGLSTRRQLLDLFRRERFDVIHVHAPLFPMLPWLAVRNAPRSAVVLGTLHSVFDSSPLIHIFRPYLQRYLDALDGIIAVSEAILPAHRNVGLDYRGVVVPNGIDLDFWQSGRRLPHFQDGSVNLLLMTRLEPRNQVELAIHALRHVLEEQPRVRLLIVGDGPMRGVIEAHVPPEMREAVHFAGQRIVDRNDYAASSDIYCFTARIGAHPISLIEGMAAGLPVIGQDIDCNRRAIDDGEQGFLVPVDDPRAYAQAILRLIRDEPLRRRMGAAAVRRAEGFGWSRIADQIEAKYLELLAMRRETAHGGDPPPCSGVENWAGRESADAFGRPLRGEK